MNGLQHRPALRIIGADATGDGITDTQEWIAEETPIALLYNGLPFAVMMATPADLEDFALGFAVCEGIVAEAGEFSLVDVVRDARGIALHGAIPQRRHDLLAERARTLEGRSGCGLCGIADLAEAVPPLPAAASAARFDPVRIHAGLESLARSQPLNARCGGVHAAAFVHADGALVREDVGRHNALDKAVGALLRAQRRAETATGFLAITSRASYEIVRKAAHAGIAVVAAMSAPTALAIREAEAAGITLIAFAREDRMTVYSGRERIVGA
jgi:formate dehydrogenase accessory protein FdhD